MCGILTEGSEMKKLLFAILALNAFGKLNAQDTIINRAEDLWGNAIAFDSLIRSPKPVLIQPFSSANCGYCLIDGYFVGKNYFETNRAKGGMNFTQCLFNPQLDVYAFTLHYRDTLTPVLTYPPELHQYHKDGFPAILAFRNGKQIVKLPQGYLSPYDSMFNILKMTLWNDSSIGFKPVSELHFATRLIYENDHFKAVCIIPDGDMKRHERQTEFASRAKCYTVKYLSEVSKNDLVHHVYFEGTFTNGFNGLLNNLTSPFRIDHDSILVIGKYSFALDTIAFSACLPNPSDPEKYLVMNIRGKNCMKGYYDNSVDFSISSCSVGQLKPLVLIKGFFGKRDPYHWTYADSLTFSAMANSQECKGICRIPAAKSYPGHAVVIEPPLKKTFPYGREFTLGRQACRFPSMACDQKGRTWVCWEENGDILLSSFGTKKPFSMAIECDRSRSYNPLITVCGNKIWVFYLNNRDGFYRLLGRSWDGIRLSEPLLFSDILPCDAVTPSVVTGNNNTIALAWTYWKANFRYPFYRILRDGNPDSIRALNVLQSAQQNDYINAWWISLASDHSGNFWGAWNQHYPAILGVCAGNLTGSPSSVTLLKDNIDDSENGGYPCALTDNTNKRWVFRESFGWDVLDGGTQKIYAESYDDVSRSWTLPTELTSGNITELNQTPGAAVDENGTIWVVWSGRSIHGNGNWALYLVCREKDGWSEPMKITSGYKPARAPRIIAGKKGELLICCHYGCGDSMKVKVFSLKTGKIRSHRN